MKTLLTITCGLFLATFNTNAACIYEQGLEGQNLQVGTMLTWSTAFEEDNSIFIVEKSEDGANFTNVGTVEAAGNSAELKDYNYLDIMANAEQTYYRLKQVDIDGSSSYTDVVSVPQVFTNNFMVARMSNVATEDVFELTIDSMVEGDLTYTVSNLRGEEVIADEMMIVAGLNDISIDLSSQEEGIYKFAMTMGDETETLVLKRATDVIASKVNTASSKKMTKGRN